MSNAVSSVIGRRVIIQVAAQPRPRPVSAADRHSIHDRVAVGQETLLERARLGDLGFEPLQVAAMLLTTPPQLEAALDEGLQDLAIERLLNEIERRTADRPDQFLVQIVDAARHQDDVQLRKAGFQPRHQLEAVELRHPDVDDGQLRVEFGGHRHGIPGRAASDDVVRVAQHALDRAKHPRFVVHDQNPRPVHDGCTCWCR